MRVKGEMALDTQRFPFREGENLGTYARRQVQQHLGRSDFEIVALSIERHAIGRVEEYELVPPLLVEIEIEVGRDEPA